MRSLAFAIACSFGWLLGCDSVATIGGVCLVDCDSATSGSRGCDGGRCDAGVVVRDAGVDARTPLDACAAGGCMTDAGPTCSDDPLELGRRRVDLMLVVDDSASLSPWWLALNDGLLQFLQDTEPSGLGVGLQIFDEICESDPHSTPRVPIAPLAQNRQALLEAVPTGSVTTSTIPALDGVLRYAQGWALDNVDSQIAVVLLTDASPGICDGFFGDYDAEAQRLARAAHSGMPSIPTYVIGFSTLLGPSPLAIAGGTEPIPISVTPADGDVRTALENIRHAEQPCAFRWPAGWMLARDSAVVVATDGGSRRYPIHPTADACAQQDGFYVDDPAAAYPLLACPRTCESFSATDRLSLSRACSEP